MADPAPLPPLTRAQVYELVSKHWSAADVVLNPNPPAGSTYADYPARDFAVEIAFAESGWIPNIHGVGPRDDSYGLFQINMLGALGPDRRTKSRLRSNTDLYDPATNVRVAYEIFLERGASFAQAWAGSFTKAMTALATANPAGGASDVPGNTHEEGLYPGQLALEDAVGGGVGGLVAVTTAILRVLGDPTFWRRLGIGALGVGALVLALKLSGADLLSKVPLPQAQLASKALKVAKSVK